MDKGGSILQQRRPIVYSALMLTGVNLLLRLASTTFQVYLSSRIGAAGIGLLQLTMSVGSLAMVAGMAGIRTATMYVAAEELGKQKPEHIPSVLSGCLRYSILSSGAIAVSLYFLAPRIAEHWVCDIRTIPALRLFSAFLPISCLSGVMTGYFTAANRIGTLAAVEVAEQLVTLLVTMTGLHFFSGSDPAKACMCVVLGGGFSACFTLLTLMILRVRENVTVDQKIAVRQRLLKTAVPLAMADDLKAGINTTENLMVPNRLSLCTKVTNPLADYGTVSGMVFPVLMFPSCILFALAELLIPELAGCKAAQRNARISRLVRKSLKVSMVYGLLCSGILFLLADPLCQRLYKSAEAGQHLKMYALLVPMLYCDAITDAMTKGLGQQAACVRYNILTSAMDVGLLYILLPKYGMQGYFISFFATHLLNFLLSLRRLLRITGQSVSAKIPVFSIAGALSALWIASHCIHPWMQAALYPLLTLSILQLLGIIGQEEFRWLLPINKK